jgi:ApaG protein
MQIEEATSHPLEHYQAVTNDIIVTMRPHYLKDRSNPESKQFFYAYKVKIENQSQFYFKVIHRHLIIRDGNKKTFTVQGPGVLGERPSVPPSGIFEYQSLCPLHTPSGSMRGKLQLQDELGETFWVDLPLVFFRQLETFVQ